MSGKIRKGKKALCLMLAAAVVITGSFMGVGKFSTHKRSINIADTARPVSGEADVSGNGDRLKIHAKAAVLIDGTSGRVLYQKNPYKHLPPASVTKVMTLLLIMEACSSGRISLKDKVTVSERAAGMGGSQMYMEPGEQHTVRELLKGVIMASANDGCVALAEYVSGSVEDFVDGMNARAEKMGLKNSHFVNTNGLPVADHYSCAYDIGMISRELIKYDEARKWFATWQEDIEVGLPGKQHKFTLTNTNKLIKSYNGATGIKTGFTQDAGYCLSGAATRNGTSMIGVVLGCKTSKIRFKEMSRLLDHGFANYETVRVADAGSRVRSVAVSKGEVPELDAVPPEDIGVTVRKGRSDSIKKKVHVRQEIEAPVRKGDVLGSITVWDGSRRLGKYDLKADRDVAKAGFAVTYIRMIKKLA